MSRTVILKDIPSDSVDQVVGDFERSGATVTKIEQSDGRYMIVAVFSESTSRDRSAGVAAMPAERTVMGAEDREVMRKEYRDFCETFLEKPYVWGAEGPDAFDCSGLVQVLLARIGLDPVGDQTAQDLHRWFRKPQNGQFVVGKPSLGHLAFFGKPLKVGHVGMCVDAESMIEAGGGGPETTSPEIAKNQGAKVRISRIDRRKNLVAVIAPRGLPWE